MGKESKCKDEQMTEITTKIWKFSKHFEESEERIAVTATEMRSKMVSSLQLQIEKKQRKVSRLQNLLKRRTVGETKQ